MQPSELIHTLLESLIGILTFDTFISPVILLSAYYLGAVILPVIIYRYVYRPFEKNSPIKLPDAEMSYGNWKLSAKWIFILSFIGFEIFWRIFFEFFIAYFQMRDALMSINTGI